eukprot:jgi/Ulvmu1/1592/UM111_0020.1
MHACSLRSSGRSLWRTDLSDSAPSSSQLPVALFACIRGHGFKTHHVDLFPQTSGLVFTHIEHLQQRLSHVSDRHGFHNCTCMHEQHGADLPEGITAWALHQQDRGQCRLAASEGTLNGGVRETGSISSTPYSPSCPLLAWAGAASTHAPA